jgi:hypothetical protein
MRENDIKREKGKRKERKKNERVTERKSKMEKRCKHVVSDHHRA